MVNSAGSEYLPYKQGVGGSNPSPRTSYYYLFIRQGNLTGENDHHIISVWSGVKVRILPLQLGKRGKMKTKIALVLIILVVLIGFVGVGTVERGGHLSGFRSARHPQRSL